MKSRRNCKKCTSSMSRSSTSAQPQLLKKQDAQEHSCFNLSKFVPLSYPDQLWSYCSLGGRNDASIHVDSLGWTVVAKMMFMYESMMQLVNIGQLVSPPT